MRLRTEQTCTNSIDLIDEDTDEVIGCILGPDEGNEDVTPERIDLAADICFAYNQL